MKKYILAIVVVVLLGVVFYNGVYVPKHTYDTLSMQKGELVKKVYATGYVGAKEYHLVSAQSGGKIEFLAKDEGEWVKKGELLAKIDPIDLPMQVQEATKSVQKAELDLKALQKELVSLEAKRELAFLNYRRYKALFDEKFVAEAEFDVARVDLQIADASLESARANIARAEAEILRSKSSLEATKQKLTTYEIYSPVDGYIIQKSVSLAQSINSSSEIYKIVDASNVWIDAYADERLSGEVAIGQSANIVLRSSSEVMAGEVKKIAPQSDAITQEREINVAFIELPKPFFINEQARVSIDVKRYKDANLIPLKVISRYENKEGVWVFRDSKAHFIPLKIVAKDDENAVVDESISEQILLPSADKKELKESMRVFI